MLLEKAAGCDARPGGRWLLWANACGRLVGFCQVLTRRSQHQWRADHLV